MAQRQRWDWRDSFTIMHHFWQIAPARSGGAAVRLEPVLGGGVGTFPPKATAGHWVIPYPGGRVRIGRGASVGQYCPRHRGLPHL